MPADPSRKRKVVAPTTSLSAKKKLELQIESLKNNNASGIRGLQYKKKLAQLQQQYDKQYRYAADPEYTASAPMFPAPRRQSDYGADSIGVRNLIYPNSGQGDAVSGAINEINHYGEPAAASSYRNNFKSGMNIQTPNFGGTDIGYQPPPVPVDVSNAIPDVFQGGTSSGGPSAGVNALTNGYNYQGLSNHFDTGELGQHQVGHLLENGIATDANMAAILAEDPNAYGPEIAQQVYQSNQLADQTYAQGIFDNNPAMGQQYALDNGMLQMGPPGPGDQDKPGFFDKSRWGNAEGLKALTGVATGAAGIYFGAKNYSLAKKDFNHRKNMDTQALHDSRQSYDNANQTAINRRWGYGTERANNLIAQQKLSVG